MFNLECITESENNFCSPDNCNPDYRSTPWCGPDDSQDPNDDRNGD